MPAEEMQDKYVKRALIQLTVFTHSYIVLANSYSTKKAAYVA